MLLAIAPAPAAAAGRGPAVPQRLSFALRPGFGVELRPPEGPTTRAGGSFDLRERTAGVQLGVGAGGVGLGFACRLDLGRYYPRVRTQLDLRLRATHVRLRLPEFRVQPRWDDLRGRFIVDYQFVLLERRF